MNKEQLKIKLDKNAISCEKYSLYGDLVLDSIVLYKNYDNWEVFYYDERGNRLDQKNFS